MTGRFQTLSIAALLLLMVMLCSCAGPIAAIVMAMQGDDDKHDPVILLVPQQYATIQAAIDATNDNEGDTVLVADGTYTGPGNRDLFVKCKTITIRSENGPGSCIIDCESSSRGFYFEASSGCLDGFTIINGSSSEGGGIYCYEHTSLTIVNCIITNNSATHGGGIYVVNQSGIHVTRCVIADNTAFRGAGIAVDGNSNPTANDCLITGNSASDKGGAIWIIHGNPTFTNCTIADNTATNSGGGLHCDGMYAPVPTFNNSILWGNSAGGNGDQMFLEGASIAVLNTTDCPSGMADIGGTGTVNRDVSIGVDPLFADAAADNYELKSTSPCIDAGDNAYVTAPGAMDIDGHPRMLDGDRGGAVIVDIGAHEFRPHVYVDDSGGDDINEGKDWATAVKSISRGLELAQDWWVVLVADGTYVGPNNRPLDFAGKYVTLESNNGNASCIIDCQNTDRAFHFHSGEANCSVLDGFTIVNGNTADSGGGILCEGSNPSIYDCVLDNCDADLGGGIACDNGSCPLIENCTISNSSAGRNGGGIFCSQGSCPTIDGCTVHANTAVYGGGIYCEQQSDPEIIRCVIRNNAGQQGGGFHCQDSCPEIISCEIKSNSATVAYGGGINCFDASPVIINCKITDNTSVSDGAGISADKCYSIISNCTIAYNNSNAMGGGVFFIYSTPVINNTIIWGNTASTGNQIYTYESSTLVELNHCDYATGVGDVEGLGFTSPSGCISLVPQFFNPGGDIYTLQPGSPCIDAGDNSLVPVGIYTDILGGPRISNGTVDLGAYEN